MPLEMEGNSSPEGETSRADQVPGIQPGGISPNLEPRRSVYALDEAGPAATINPSNELPPGPRASVYPPSGGPAPENEPSRPKDLPTYLDSLGESFRNSPPEELTNINQRLAGLLNVSADQLGRGALLEFMALLRDIYGNSSSQEYKDAMNQAVEALERNNPLENGEDLVGAIENLSNRSDEWFMQHQTPEPAAAGGGAEPPRPPEPPTSTAQPPEEPNQPERIGPNEELTAGGMYLWHNNEGNQLVTIVSAEKDPTTGQMTYAVQTENGLMFHNLNNADLKNAPRDTRTADQEAMERSPIFQRTKSAFLGLQTKIEQALKREGSAEYLGQLREIDNDAYKALMHAIDEAHRERQTDHPPTPEELARMDERYIREGDGFEIISDPSPYARTEVVVPYSEDPATDRALKLDWINHRLGLVISSPDSFNSARNARIVSEIQTVITSLQSQYQYFVPCQLEADGRPKRDYDQRLNYIKALPKERPVLDANGNPQLDRFGEEVRVIDGKTLESDETQRRIETGKIMEPYLNSVQFLHEVMLICNRSIDANTIAETASNYIKAEYFNTLFHIKEVAECFRLYEKYAVEFLSARGEGKKVMRDKIAREAMGTAYNSGELGSNWAQIIAENLWRLTGRAAFHEDVRLREVGNENSWEFIGEGVGIDYVWRRLQHLDKYLKTQRRQIPVVDRLFRISGKILKSTDAISRMQDDMKFGILSQIRGEIAKKVGENGLDADPRLLETANLLAINGYDVKDEATGQIIKHIYGAKELFGFKGTPADENTLTDENTLGKANKQWSELTSNGPNFEKMDFEHIDFELMGPSFFAVTMNYMVRDADGARGKLLSGPESFMLRPSYEAFKQIYSAFDYQSNGKWDTKDDLLVEMLKTLRHDNRRLFGSRDYGLEDLENTILAARRDNLIRPEDEKKIAEETMYTYSLDQNWVRSLGKKLGMKDESIDKILNIHFGGESFSKFILFKRQLNFLSALISFITGKAPH